MHRAPLAVLLVALATLGCHRPHGTNLVRSKATVSPAPSAIGSPAEPNRRTALFHPGDGATEPEVISYAQPVLPTSSIPRHVGGGAFVFEVIVAADGRVESARTLRRPNIQPPWPAFEEAYRQAVLSGRYRPATYEGEPVAYCLTVSVGFHL